MNYLNLLKNKVFSEYQAFRDFQTSKHIVVFESDDWGSIRVPNIQVWNQLLDDGYAVDKRPYERLDTLESPEDIETLFDVLSSYKDYLGNHPIITINMLMANPDFERINNSGFNKYYYEPVSDTYSRYYGNNRVLELLRQGFNERLIMPQCHGREHFNIQQWMFGLKSGNEDLLTAFKYGMCGIPPKNNPRRGNPLMKALFAHNQEEQSVIDRILIEGLQMFESMWGFKSDSFVAPCYCWNKPIENVLVQNGVVLLQTARMNKPSFNYPSHFYYSGQRSPAGLTYSIRNCMFEPATDEKRGNECSLLKQIDHIFKKGKIAVVSTHRINYVGGIDINNRKRTITALNIFLKKLLEKYPDVEFKSSNSLIQVFHESSNS